MGILLSIIIPCYNSASFVEKTIQMLLKQDLNNCELIFVNDGSKDDTLSIINGFAEKYAYISVYDQENAGVSVARNNGLKCAKGKYVYFFDSDDLLTDDTIKYYKTKIEEMGNVDLFAYGYQSEKNNVVIRKYVSNDYDNQVGSGIEFLNHLLETDVHFHICSCLFKRDFLENNRLKFAEGIKIGEDTDFIRKALCNANKVYYGARIGFRYVLREQSVTNGNTYNYSVFQSFKFTASSIMNLYNYTDVKTVNYFLATRYARHLLNYLSSKVSDKKISEGLREYRYILYQDMYYLRKKPTLLIMVLRIIPVSILYVFFGKR